MGGACEIFHKRVSFRAVCDRPEAVNSGPTDARQAKNGGSGESVSGRRIDDRQSVVGAALLWLANLADGRRATKPIFTLYAAYAGTAAGYY